MAVRLGPGTTVLYEASQVAYSLSDSTLPSCSHCPLSTPLPTAVIFMLIYIHFLKVIIYIYLIIMGVIKIVYFSYVYWPLNFLFILIGG